MNVLVVGCGRLGSRLACILDSHGHDVAIVDENPDSFHNLGKNFSGITIVGMPMDIKVLRSAGIEGCDAMAVATPDDNLNITVSQIAKEFFGIENVIARISDPLRENVFKKFGLKTVCPTNLAGDAMFTALTAPWEPKHVTFGSSTAAFYAKEVGKGQGGLTLAQFSGNSSDQVFGVISHDDCMLLYKDAQSYMLNEGDKVILTSVVD